MGRRERPDDGHRRRPHAHTLGQIPSLSAVGGRSVLDMRHPAFHHPRLGLWCQARVGLCDLHTHDDRLHGHKCPLRSHARRDDRQLAGEDGVLVLPHVFCLRRLFHSPLCVGPSVLHVQRQSWHDAPDVVADGHVCHRFVLLRAVSALLQAHPRAHRDCGHGHAWQ